jgi:serine/threonine protein kinase
MANQQEPIYSHPGTDPVPLGVVLNALPTGFRLQEYTLESVLGYGGFGITYLATDHNLNCHVAIKEYLPSDQAVRCPDFSLQPKSPDAVPQFEWGLSRFIEEARALASFHHPHIVRVLRYFEAHSSAYMVMELIAGEPLGEWIKLRRPLSEASILAIAKPVLDGLGVIHAAGFVHRDIKPGNIHMRTDTDPVLLDFGAARNVQTRTGGELTAIVTPGYAALEQYHSHGNQGPWTDIYSIAAVMYSLAVGQRPIEAPARVRNDPLPRAVEVGDRSLYSETLLRAIDWGLAPAEEQRPQSVLAFLQALPVGPLAQHPSMAELPTELASAIANIDPAVTAELEAALARHLGPMASVVVKRQAKMHRSLQTLRAALADEIESDNSRRVFLDRTEALLKPVSRPPTARQTTGTVNTQPSAPVASGPPRFEPQFLAAVETELAQHLGPLAAVLIRKSAAKARDQAELFLMLSDHIADADQRRAFIRRSVAAFKHRG